jgi:hypothetical protein
VRTEAMKWFVDNSSAGGASIGIGLSPTAATTVQMTATDGGQNQQTATQSITWTVTDLAQSPAAVTIRKGDSLLLTATGTGTTLTIDGNGDGTFEFSGAPGDNYACTYNTTGTITARAKIDGVQVGTLSVTIVDSTLPNCLVCAVGLSVTRLVSVAPTSQASNVTVNHCTDLTVGFTNQVVSGGVNVAFLATDVVPGLMFARIGGADGPVMKMGQVQPCKLIFTGPDTPRQEVSSDGNAKFGFSLTMSPYYSGAYLKFVNGVGGNTFDNGQSTMYQYSQDIFPGVFIYYVHGPRNGATCNYVEIEP